MKIDAKTSEYFHNIRQVFLYLGDKCNLLCEQCLYKPNVVKGNYIAPETARNLLKIFRDLGAFKLTVLGGEISLYDIENQYAGLLDVLQYARTIGYEYIRIDTNGQLESFFRRQNIFQYIDEVSFSIDGYNAETNDCLRGPSSFEKSVQSLKTLKRTCPKVKINITACVTKQNVFRAGSIVNFIENMIQFSHANEIGQLNFHGVFKMGVPMDVWTGDSHLPLEEWYQSVQIIRDNIERHKYPIDVRFPVHLITREEFQKHPQYYGYCPCKLGERALIHPDGIIRVCSSLLSTPYGVAHYNDTEIRWNEYNNELTEHKMNEFTPCTNQRLLYTDKLCPVCFSLKPHQNEIVWKKCGVENLKNKEA